MVATGRYISGRVAQMRGKIDLLNDVISAALVDTSLYQVSLAEDVDLSDLPVGAIISQTVLTGKTIDEAACVLKADDLVFSNVPVDGAERTGGAVVLYVDAEDYDDCYLILYRDDIDGFPVEPDDTDIVLNWPDDGILIL